MRRKPPTPQPNAFPEKKGKKTSLSWSEDAETAFLDIKNKLTDVALLSYPVKNAETAIFVDASQYACGSATFLSNFKSSLKAHYFNLAYENV